MPAVMKIHVGALQSRQHFLAAFLRGHGAPLGAATRAQATAALGPRGSFRWALLWARLC